MSLEGQLGTIPLPELLQLLAIGRKTGTLVIVRGETEHRIVVDSGRAVSTETGEPEIRLDRLLLRKGLIDGAALKRAKELEAASGLPLWQVLLTLQVLGEDDLREALEEKAGLLVAHLFHASDASFDFVENEVTGDGPLGLSLDLTQLVVSAAWDLERPPTAEMGATIEGVEVPGEETGQENGSPLPLSAPAAELLEEPFPEVPPTTPISVSHRRRAVGGLAAAAVLIAALATVLIVFRQGEPAGAEESVGRVGPVIAQPEAVDVRGLDSDAAALEAEVEARLAIGTAQLRDELEGQYRDQIAELRRQLAAAEAAIEAARAVEPPSATDREGEAPSVGIAPILISRPVPVYPAAAERQGRDAEVTVRVLVGEDGSVLEVEPAEPSAGRGFDRAASRAAKRSVWQPATEGGQPVRRWTELRFSFEAP